MNGFKLEELNGHVVKIKNSKFSVIEGNKCFLRGEDGGNKTNASIKQGKLD